MWQTLGLGLQKKICMDKDYQFEDKNTPKKRTLKNYGRKIILKQDIGESQSTV